MATDMTAEQAEQYVRERWLSRAIVEQQADEFGKLSLWKMHDTLYATEADAWLAAAEYTRAHEQKIAEKREEIGCIREYLATSKSIDSIEGVPASDHTAVFQRILIALEAQLAELLRGWRQL